jgi:hypothetical protein
MDLPETDGDETIEAPFLSRDDNTLIELQMHGPILPIALLKIGPNPASDCCCIIRNRFLLLCDQECDM